MGILVTTAQAADHIRSTLDGPDGSPVVTAAKVLTQVEAGLFTDVGPGRSVRIDIDEINHALKGARYVADPTAEFGATIFRVSVIAARPNPVWDLQNGMLLRPFAGVDYSSRATTAPADTRGGYEGVWEVADATCRQLLADKALLLATCKGYVNGDDIRPIAAWLRCRGTARKYFRTTSPSKKLRKLIGASIWIDVPPGRESGIL